MSRESAAGAGFLNADSSRGVERMIRSMTAFARTGEEGDWGSLTWELRSVNHRYLEVSLRLPEELRALEPRLRELAAGRLGRGKLEGTLRWRQEQARGGELHLDEEILTQVLQAAETVAEAAGEVAPLNALDVLRWPGVIQEQRLDLEPVQEEAAGLFEAALADLVATREREGARIRGLLTERLDAMVPLVAGVRDRLPEVRRSIRDRLTARLEEVAAGPDADRLEQELVYVAQKMDVDEELDRLEAHIAEIREVLERDEPVGRRLDFLIQELNREANTLASKSADAETTRVAVELKVLIEQLREQVQNVE